VDVCKVKDWMGAMGKTKAIVMNNEYNYAFIKNKYKKCICWYCLLPIENQRDYSDEHPIPKCIFSNNSNANDFIVPAHKKCNRLSSNDDEKFFHTIFYSSLMYQLQISEFNNDTLTRKFCVDNLGMPFDRFERGCNRKYHDIIPKQSVRQHKILISGKEALLGIELDSLLLNRAIVKIANGLNYRYNMDSFYRSPSKISEVNYNIEYYDNDFVVKNDRYQRNRILNEFFYTVDPGHHKPMISNAILDRNGNEVKISNNTYAHAVSENNFIIWFYKSIVLDVSW
jgi:hypothetical protein